MGTTIAKSKTTGAKNSALGKAFGARGVLVQGSVAYNLDSLAATVETMRSQYPAGARVYFYQDGKKVRLDVVRGKIPAKQIYQVEPATVDDPMAKADPEDCPIQYDSGRDLRAEIRSSLQPKEVADRLQVTPATVNNYRKQKKILGFERANRYMYPAWQFDPVTGSQVAGLEAVLGVLFSITEDPTEVLALLIKRRDFFEGRSIKDLLLSGDVDGAMIGAQQSAGR